jgi:hypothetical protein
MNTQNRSLHILLFTAVLAPFCNAGPANVGHVTTEDLGECFLMRTLEKDLVLARLVSVDADRRARAIQWVKAAPGPGTFEIPQGPLVDPEPQSSGSNRTTRTVPQLSPSDVARLEEQWKRRNELTKKVDGCLASRQSLIQYCMDVVEEAASEPNKASLNPEVPIAVQALGQLGAAQAAPVLVKIIDVPLPVDPVVLELSLSKKYACVDALTALGKPGAVACLVALSRMTPAEWTRPLRARLPLLVILRVEGEKVARFVLEEKEKVLSDQEQVNNIERAIALIDEMKSFVDASSDPYALEKSN